MKTKALGILLAILASASMVPVASAQRANGKFGSPDVGRNTPTLEARTAQRTLPDSCVSDACCNTKTKIRTTGGRATGISTAKVVACKTTCQVATNDQRAVCGKGRRA